MNVIYYICGALTVLLLEGIYMLIKSMILSVRRKREVTELLNKIRQSQSLTYTDEDGDEWSLIDKQ